MKNLIAWILQLTVAVLLAYYAWPKLSADPHSVANFEELGMGAFGRVLIGLLELITAVLLVIPPSAAWGALLGWGIMSGALIAHLTRLGFEGNAGALGALALAIWIATTIILVLRRSQVPIIRCMFDMDEASRTQL